MIAVDPSVEETLQKIVHALPSAPWNTIACAAGGQAATLSEADVCPLQGALSASEMAKGYARSIEIIQAESVARAIQCGAHYLGLAAPDDNKGSPHSMDEIRQAYCVGAALRQLCVYAEQMAGNTEHKGFLRMISDMSSRVRLPSDLEERKAVTTVSDLGFAPKGSAAIENLRGLIGAAKARSSEERACSV